MGFKIPFTLASPDALRKRTKFFLSLAEKTKAFPKLKETLKSCDAGLTKAEYLAICLYSFILSLIIFSTFFTTILGLLRVEFFYIYGFFIAFLFSAFLFFILVNYPKIYLGKKNREIEKNLISALRDMLVQLTSGIPLFEILVNISNSDYGEVSKEFKIAVKEINTGKPQIEVLDDLGKRNPSQYFRRALWQISNGMRAGSDIGIVIKSSLENLQKEQVLQIQNYGSRLNPIIMFYMLIAIILPSLSITFFTIIFSIIGLSGTLVTMLYITLFVFIVLIQIVFLGLIKTRRPSLI